MRATLVLAGLVLARLTLCGAQNDLRFGPFLAYILLTAFFVFHVAPLC